MPDNSTNNKRIAKNTVFLYLRMLLVLVVSLYTTRVVLKVLGITDYGIYNVVAGFVSMFAFLNTSMSIGIQRFYNFEKGKENGYSQNMVFNTALSIQAIISLCTFILLESFGLWYVNTVMVIPSERLFATNVVFQMAVLSLLIVIFQVPYSAAIMAYEKMDYFAAVSIVDVALKLAIALVLPHLHGDRLIFYGIAIAGVSVINLLLYWGYIKIRCPELRIKRGLSRELFRPMFSFSVWNLFDMFAYTLKGQGLNVLLNGYFGPVVNAARGVASQVMSSIQGFSSNIVTAFRPQVVESYAQIDYDRTKSLMYGMSKISYALLFIFSLPIFLELDYILNVWLGGVVPNYTIVFTRLVLLDMLVSSLNTPLSQVVQATGRLKRYQVIRSFVISSILPISWICLRLGASPSSVFIVGLVVSIINQPVSLILLHRIFTFSYNDYINKVISPCIIFSILAIVCPYIVHSLLESGLVRFLVVGLLSVGITLILAYRVMLSSIERQSVKSFLKSYLKIGVMS